jgi:hypothetical protein
VKQAKGLLPSLSVVVHFCHIKSMDYIFGAKEMKMRIHDFSVLPACFLPLPREY